VFPEAGDYCVIDGPVPKEASVSVQATKPRLLTTVTVTAGTPVPDITEHVTQALKTAARTFMPAAIRADIENDLGNGLRLTSFVPHPDLPAATVATPQQLVFGVFPLGIGDGTKEPAPYDPTRIDRKLTLGAIEDWTLTALPGLGPHPFHIHVNPFQILSVVRKSDGADMTADPTSQYARMKGVWKDTVIVQDDVTVTVRTQYRRYIGDFVLHCHILDHEDRGMMQRVRILLSDGQGGQEESGHTHP
jgi:L-ascorbate oxidase